jgi:hypothetical protein
MGRMSFPRFNNESDSEQGEQNGNDALVVDQDGGDSGVLPDWDGLWHPSSFAATVGVGESKGAGSTSFGFKITSIRIF